MEPRIDAARFGTISVEGKVFKHDIVITLDGKVKKRKKQLSKKVYGTSHTLSLAETKAIWEKNVNAPRSAKTLIIGTGHFDRVRLSSEAREYLEQEGCQVRLLPTTKAIQLWNETPGNVMGLFHITC